MVHVPKRDPADFRVLRWSNRPSFEVGVEHVSIRDVSFRCTTRERTLVDLVRYGRHLGGLATAARSLHAYSAAGGRGAAVRCMADAMRIPRPARLGLDALLLGMDNAS
jgi:predicted transcriptional regulator of viral defense system